MRLRRVWLVILRWRRTIVESGVEEKWREEIGAGCEEVEWSSVDGMMERLDFVS
jgi:hypothetical protein